MREHFASCEIHARQIHKPELPEYKVQRFISKKSITCRAKFEYGNATC